MAPVTRSLSKKQSLSLEESKAPADMDKSGQSVEDGVNAADKDVADKDIADKNGVTGPSACEADLNTAILSAANNISAGEHPQRGLPAVLTENWDAMLSNSSNSTFEEQDWLLWGLDIEATLLAATDDPSTLFFNCGLVAFSDGNVVCHYSHNGEFFVIRDNGQPWRWPVVRVDPATLGLPYDPETNAEDAALELTVALPHSVLRNDAVFIKEFFNISGGSTVGKPYHQRWLHEVRMLELLARKHPHPNFVRYLGCRVIEVPGGTAADDVPRHAGEKRKRVQRRITGIVLENVERCINNYDPDDDRWSRILEPAVFLKRLEAAVLYLHSVGLAHNDLKPSNVMVRADGQPVLIDFESCAPPGTKLNTGGTQNWTENFPNYISSFENDLYALRLFRERIGDKEARNKYFLGY